MEIKVECVCGQRFKFDAEPVNDVMPYTVNCPTCGADGTAQANAIIQEQLAAAPTPTIAPAPVPATQPGLRINRPTTPSAAPLVSESPSARKAVGTGYVPPVPKKPLPSGYIKGASVALAAAILGMLGWFLMIKVTGKEFGYAAWGVGLLTGAGARVTGASTSQKLGLTCALFALLAILGGEFLAMRSFLFESISKISDIAYDKRMENSKTALALVTETDIKSFISKQEEKDIAAVTAEDVKAFREETIPACRDFVDGKVSREQFRAEIQSNMSSFGAQLRILKKSFSGFTIAWALFGIASAYKLGVGVEGKVIE